MKGFWEAVMLAAAIAAGALLVATLFVLTRPHAGHRAPAHWEAATILLLAVVGLLVICAVAVVTRMELDD